MYIFDIHLVLQNLISFSVFSIWVMFLYVSALIFTNDPYIYGEPFLHPNQTFSCIIILLAGRLVAVNLNYVVIFLSGVSVTRECIYLHLELDAIMVVWYKCSIGKNK